jgi:hypothetical protein
MSTAARTRRLHFRHKTDAVVLHPLEDRDGTAFYADAESILAQVPRRGVPMVLHVPRGKTADGKPKPAKPYAMSSVEHLVQRLRKAAGLPTTFTLDACRHGGMTELEEAELTGRALAATRKRHAHRLANESGTKFGNGGGIAFGNGGKEQKEIAE